MTAETPAAAPASGAGLLDLVSPSPDGQLYQSAVRFTRLYAMFSPTMVALLMAKKTRLGRYIPLPDALPDGFRWRDLTSLGGNGGQENGDGQATNGAGLHGENGTNAPLHTTPAASVNGAHAQAVAVIPTVAAPGVNGAGPAKAEADAARARPLEYEVAHHVPGRLRLSMPRLAHDARFAQRLEEAVMALPDVSRVRVSSSSRSLVVEYRHRSMSARRRAALLPEVIGCIRTAAGVDAVQNVLAETAPEPPHVDVTARMALPALSLGLSAGMLAGLAVPPALLGGLVLLSARPILARAIEGLRTEKRLTVETLDMTTIALMVSQGAFLAPSIIVGIIEGGQAARDWTARRRPRMTLAQILPPEQRVQVIDADGPERRRWEEIEPGDELLLFEGDLIPADGLVLEGAALLDQSRLTGDPHPAAVQVGGEVRAGGVVVEGRLRVLAQQIGHDSAAGQAVALIQAGPPRDTRVSNYPRKVGNWAVVPTLLIGGAVYAASGSLVRATGIVNLDLGTGMRVASPAAVFVTQRRAARMGIEFRSGAAIEMLAWAEVMAFSRPGALAEGRAVIDRLRELACETQLLSGDGEDAVSRAAAQLGIEPAAARFGLSSQERLEAVQAIQADGRRVAFVGHGVDDVAAMRQADVSIAPASAGDLARETADIVLCNDDLADLPRATALARHTLRLLHQDMGMVAAINVGAIGYGAAAALGPTAPMLINNGAWVLATLNSMRRFKDTK